MLFTDEGSIALKEIGGILDECLARRHRVRLSGFCIRELLCDLRHFAVEARLIPRRRLTFNARIMVDKCHMGIFELLHPNLERGCSERGAGTEEKSDCTDRNAKRCQKDLRIFKHNCYYCVL